MIYQKYAFKPGAHVMGNMPAQVVGEELARLTDIWGGAITPEKVLHAARSASCPLHPAFEWEDSAAAEAYRLHQARQLLGAVVVIREMHDAAGPPPPPRRVFVNVTQPETNERVYMPVADALADATLRRQILTRAYQEYKAWENKYRDLIEYAEVFTTAERVMSAVLAPSAESEAA